MLEKRPGSLTVFAISLVVASIFSMCSRNKSTADVKKDLDSLNDVFALERKTMPVSEEMTVRDFLSHGKWLKLGVDEEGYFYLNLDPCDSITIRTLAYEFASETLMENSIQSSIIYKIKSLRSEETISDGIPTQSFMITYDNSEYESAELDYSIIIEPIDDLHPEWKICKFYKILSRDTISFSRTDAEFNYFIPDIHLTMVNHKVTDPCLETY